MFFKEIEFESSKPNLRVIESLSVTLGHERLSRIYDACTADLSHRHVMTTIKTHAELHLHSQLKKKTRLKIFSSVWIGRFCVDFFIPSVAGERINGKAKMRGLAIEVNGPIHNFQPKMSKDENRGDVLAMMGIGVLNLENADLESPANRHLIANIRNLPRLSWRSRQRLWARVHAWTILANNFLHYRGSN